MRGTYYEEVSQKNAVKLFRLIDLFLLALWDNLGK